VHAPRISKREAIARSIARDRQKRGFRDRGNDRDMSEKLGVASKKKD
jgi:hypothetical protein